MIRLGETYKDTVSGWEGVATARTEYWHGSVKVCLEANDEKGKPTDVWFPEERLESVVAMRRVGLT